MSKNQITLSDEEAQFLRTLFRVGKLNHAQLTIIALEGGANGESPEVLHETQQSLIEKLGDE